MQASTHHSFIFNSRFLNTRFVSLKACGIFHFRLRFVFIKVYFFVKKTIESLTLKRNSKNSKWLTRTYSFITIKITRSLNILVRKQTMLLFSYTIYIRPSEKALESEGWIYSIGKIITSFVFLTEKFKLLVIYLL